MHSLLLKGMDFLFSPFRMSLHPDYYNGTLPCIVRLAHVYCDLRTALRTYHITVEKLEDNIAQ